MITTALGCSLLLVRVYNMDVGLWSDSNAVGISFASKKGRSTGQLQTAGFHIGTK